MKTVAKTKIRATFRHPGLIAQGDVRMKPGGLACRVVVFEKPIHLRYFWHKYISDVDLGRGCLGAVNKLRREVTLVQPGKPDKTWQEVDRKYFAVCGLCREHLTMRILTHESVHVAYAYAMRTTRNWWYPMGRDMEEEVICYPTGEFAAALCRFLERKKLFSA